MSSKLKIIVDYPCEVYCDYQHKGNATPNSIFYIELRMGTYYLEFKVNDIVQESLDYKMGSNDQEDLLRVNLISTIELNSLSVDKKSKTIRDNDEDDHFIGDFFINNKEFARSQNRFTLASYYSCLKKNRIDKLILVFEEQNIDAYDEGSPKSYKMECAIILNPNESVPQKILIDTAWLHCSYGNYWGKFTLYTGSIIKIYTVNNSKIVSDNTIDVSAGLLYNITKTNNYALTIKNGKFGIYDIKHDRIVCRNDFEELYLERLEYHGEVIHAFITADKYTIEEKGKKGIISSNGEVIAPCIYDTANPCSIGYIVQKNLKWGLSRNGEIPTEWFDDIFSSEHTGYGVVHSHIFDKSVDFIQRSNFPSSCLLYFKKNNKFGFWDVNGQRSSELYDWIETDDLLDSGLSRLIKTRLNGKFGFIDCFGQVIIPCSYDEIFIARNDHNLTLYCDYKLLVNKSIKTRYIADSEKEARESGDYSKDLPLGNLLGSYLNYHEPLYIAIKDGKYGVCSIEGGKRIPFKYDSIRDLDYNNDCFIVELDGLFGALNADNQVILPINYKDIKKLKSDFTNWLLGW